MLDSLLELFENDRGDRKGSPRPGGLRGRLSAMLSDDGDHSRDYREDERPSDRRDRDDDRDEGSSSKRRKSREFEFMDFGD